MTFYAWPDDGLRILDEPSQTDAPEDRAPRPGGMNWGAGFFGWLVAVAVAALVLAALAGLVVALDRLGAAPARDGAGARVAAWALGLGGLLVAYYAGGYVAGRMSRFDGGLQGLAVWIVGLLPTSAAVGLGLELAPVHDLLGRLSTPVFQSGASVILLRDLALAVLVALGPLLAAMVGGRVGCHYHQKVDEVIDLAARLGRR